jgi:transposase-like protein
MGQVLHRGATTTEAIQRSQASLRTLAHRHGINPKMVAKWRKRCSVADLRTGPKHPRPTVLTVQEEAVIVAFRRHTPLPLDDCLYALQATIPHLTRSSLHRGLNTMASAGCPKWRAVSREGRSSTVIRSASSLSIWPKCIPRKASSTSSWLSTALRSSLSLNWWSVLTCRLLRDSSKR